MLANIRLYILTNIFLVDIPWVRRKEAEIELTWKQI